MSAPPEPAVLPDEESWAVPPEWVGHLLPRHGGTVVPKPSVEAETAVRRLREWLRPLGRAIRERSRHGAEEIAAGEEFVAAVRAGGPLPATVTAAGGAVALAVLVSTGKANPDARTTHKPVYGYAGRHLCDGLVVACGLRFTVEAVARMAGEPGGWELMGPRRAQSPRILALLGRAREHLAAAATADYDAHVALLGELREEADLVTRLVTLYLAPTRADWAAEDLAAAAAAHPSTYPASLLLGCAADLAGVEFALSRLHTAWADPPPIAYVMVNAVEAAGPGAVRVVADWITREQARLDLPAWLGELGRIPTDEAFRQVLRWVHRPKAAPVGEELTRRYPVRAVRLLAGAAGDPAPLGPAAARLLAICCRIHPVAARRAEAALGGAARERVSAIIGAASPATPVASDVDLPKPLVHSGWTAGERPEPPPWLDPAVLPEVLLRGRRLALPEHAVRELCALLAASGGERPHADLAAVTEACDPVSVARFAWAVCERWWDNGRPADAAWALRAQRWVADERTIRDLAQLLQDWPAERGGAQRTAIDVLCGLGTEQALSSLSALARHAGTNDVIRLAAQRLRNLAAENGWTATQLADRLVPRFGLDDTGSLELDYGGRRFTVGFDDQLTPYVRDTDGRRRKSLPAAGPQDDPTRVAAAKQRFTVLRKEVQATARDQVARFETAMLNRETWTGADLRERLIAHPLLRHLVRRLVWAAETTPFRVAEDHGLVDADDQPVTVADTAAVRVAHPVDLGDRVADWQRVFADYEIAQPFPQLDRAVHLLDEAELDPQRLTRFAGVSIPGGRYPAMKRRGWRLRLGQASRSFDDAWVTVKAEPGFYPQYARHVQTVTEVELAPVSWGALPAQHASELLADLIALTGPEEDG